MNHNIYVPLSLILLSIANLLSAQGPISGFMPKKGALDIAISYSAESYDNYLFGKERQNRSNQLESYSLFLEHGLQDKLALVVNVPYISVDETNRGLQDGSIFLKYRNSKKAYSGSELNILTAIGLSFPLSNYPTTDGLRSIGAKATQFQARLAAQHRFNMGLFFNLQAGFDFQLIPTAQTAIPILFRTGFGAKWWYIEAWVENYAVINNESEANLQAQGGPGSAWVRIGGTFYVPINKKFGAFIGGAKILSGQNIGLSNRINIGVVSKLQLN